MKQISEYDLRQLRLMYDCLISFEKHQIDLQALISTLDFLLSTLEIIDSSWKEKFSEEVFNLECVYSLSHVQEEETKVAKISKEEAEQIIRDAVNNLKIFVKISLDLERD